MADKPLRDPEADRVRLEEWMSHHLAGAADLRIVELIAPEATGFSNQTWMFRTVWTEAGRERRGRFVARIEPRDGGLFPAQTKHTRVSVELQHRIMQTVSERADVPIPTLLPFEPDPEILGQPFFVMKFVEGVVPADTPRYTQAGFLVEEATPEQRRQLIFDGIGVMARLHALDWRAAGLEWLDASGCGAPSMEIQLALYRQDAERKLRGRDHPVLMQALDWLDAHCPSGERIGLTWGDARIGNMIWRDYRCQAVLDWEACALSPTECDLGWWLMFDRNSHEHVGADRLDGFPSRDEQTRHYESLTGRPAPNVFFHEVFATMRFCVIMIQLMDRFEASGIQREGPSPAIDNGVTHALAELLEM